MTFTDKLFLKGFIRDTGEIDCDIQTLISIFTLSCCENYSINLYIVNDNEKFFKFFLSTEVLKLFKITSLSKESFKQVKCKLPAIKTSDGIIIGGLCAVLRWSIKSVLKISPNCDVKNLLGFRGGCLTACSESSIWTKFCEVELLEALKELSEPQMVKNVPEALLKLEEHLKCPVRTHNISRRKIDLLKKLKKKENAENIGSEMTDIGKNFKDLIINEVQHSDSTVENKNDVFELNHCYLEGIDLTLVDVIVLPVVHIILF